MHDSIGAAPVRNGLCGIPASRYTLPCSHSESKLAQVAEQADALA